MPADLRSAVHPSPLGPLTLLAGPEGLRSLRFGDDGAGATEGAARGRDLDEAVAQLDEYFAGDRRGFDLRLDLGGTELQRRVWDELALVPHGETVTYAELARRVGRPEAVRAVAGAVARTPVPIVVPCHRAIGTDGGLHGYVGGLERKAALLALERGGG
jgi:methylated-DNA-[protein]-cysteine S-methyltransferase